jgi:hypothetical protein
MISMKSLPLKSSKEDITKYERKTEDGPQETLLHLED